MFTGCRLVTGSNAVASSVSVFTPLLAGECLPTTSALLRNGLRQWGLLRQGRLSTTTSDGSVPQLLLVAADSRLCKLVLHITPRQGPHRKRRFQHFYCCVKQLSHGPRREHLFLVNLLVGVRNPLPSNGRCLQSHYIATGLHATIALDQI
jgi:hypothetical protein